MITLIFSLFAWGFSKKVEADTVTVPNLSGIVTDGEDSEPLVTASEEKQPETI